MRKDGILNFINRIGSAIIKIVLYAIVARSLGVVEFGQFIFLISILTVISQIILNGAEYNIVNLRETIRIDRLITYTWLKTFLLVVISFLILILFVDNKLSMAIAFYIGSQILNYMIQSIFLKYNKYSTFVILNLILVLIPIIIMVLLDVNSLYQVLLIISLPKFLLILICLPHIKINTLYYLRDIFKIYDGSFKYLMFEQLKFVHHRFDIVLLSLLGQNYITGLLGAIKNIVEGTQHIPKTIQLLMYKYFKSEQSIMRLSSLFISCIFIVLLLIFFFAGEEIIFIIFGEDFIEINDGLLISLIGGYFYSLSHVNMSSIININRNPLRLNVTIAIFYIVSYTTLILLYGYYGAIFAFVISSIFYYWVTLFYKGRK